MKILHTYEDGTIKVVLDDGKVSLFPPCQDIEIKILAKVNGKTFTIPMAGGIPTEIEEHQDAPWIKLSGTNLPELLYKSLVNFGFVCGRAMGEKALYHFISCIVPIKAILCGDGKITKNKL